MDGNTTGKKDVLPGEFPQQAVIGLMFFFSITDITNIIGNTLVLAIVFGNFRLQTNTNIFITNLCLVDLISGILLMPMVMNALVTNEAMAGRLCEFSAFIDAIYSTGSSLTIATIAVDRYHSIVNCLYYETIVTHKRTVLAIIWIWVQTLVISICPILGWGTYSFDPHQLKCSLQLPDKHGFLYFLTSTSVVLPYTMLVFCYTQIHLVARRHARSMVAIQIHDTGRRIKSISSRKTKLVYLVVGLYSVCWLPYYSIQVLQSTMPGLGIPSVVVTLATALSLLNGSCNPFLYALITSHYRVGLRRLYRRWKRRVGRTNVSPSVDPSKSSWSFSRPISSLYRFLQDQQDTGITLKCVAPINESSIAGVSGLHEGSKVSLRASTPDRSEKQVLLKPTGQTLQLPDHHRNHRVKKVASAEKLNYANGWTPCLTVPDLHTLPRKSSKAKRRSRDLDSEEHVTCTKHRVVDERIDEMAEIETDSKPKIGSEKKVGVAEAGKACRILVRVKGTNDYDVHITIIKGAGGVTKIEYVTSLEEQSTKETREGIEHRVRISSKRTKDCAVSEEKCSEGNSEKNELDCLAWKNNTDMGNGEIKGDVENKEQMSSGTGENEYESTAKENQGVIIRESPGKQKGESNHQNSGEKRNINRDCGIGESIKSNVERIPEKVEREDQNTCIFKYSSTKARLKRIGKQARKISCSRESVANEGEKRLSADSNEDIECLVNEWADEDGNSESSPLKDADNTRDDGTPDGQVEGCDNDMNELTQAPLLERSNSSDS